MGHTMQVKLLGVRGTLPVHGPEFARFGGATSCVLVRAGGETILFDAGTGLSGRAWRDFFPEKHGTDHRAKTDQLRFHTLAGISVRLVRHFPVRSEHLCLF